MSVTELYDKEVQQQFSFEFYDLTHTGSWDDDENQVIVLTVPEDIGREVRKLYRSRNPHGISDFEVVKQDDSWDIYVGGSYGAGSLFGAVGELLYYGESL